MLIAVFDTETTGIGEDHRIIEIAAIMAELRFDGAFGYVERGRFERRIQPGRSIAPSAQAVHGISLADLAGCPTLEALAAPVGALLGRADLWVAHNAGFDVPFMEREWKRVGVPLPLRPTFDTMIEGKWANPDGKVPTLAELCWATDVSYDPSKAHAALYDVEVTLRAFIAGLNLHGGFSPPSILTASKEKAA